jgi:hypothetical protein
MNAAYINIEYMTWNKHWKNLSQIWSSTSGMSSLISDVSSPKVVIVWERKEGLNIDCFNHNDTKSVH